MINLNTLLLSTPTVWALWALVEALAFFFFARSCILKEKRPVCSLWQMGLFVLLLVLIQNIHMDFYVDIPAKILTATGFLYLCCHEPFKRGLYAACVFYFAADFARLLSLTVIMQRLLYEQLIQAGPLTVTWIHIALLFLSELAFGELLRPMVFRQRLFDYTLRQMVLLFLPTLSYLALRYFQFSFSTLDDSLLLVVLLIMASALASILGTEIFFAGYLKRIEAFGRQQLEKQAEQFSIKQELLEDFNRKYHDFKYQLRSLEAMEDIEAVRNYTRELREQYSPLSAFQQTGNSVLDTLIAEKMIFSANHQITMICDVEGNCLDFVSPMDLCTLLCNALDNAFEAVQRLSRESEPEIHLKIKRINRMAAISIRNDFDGQLLPQGQRLLSRKQNGESHGFGMESIRQIAEKYRGSVAYTAEKDVFTLNLLLPIP